MWQGVINDTFTKEGKLWDVDGVTNNVAELTTTNTGKESYGNSTRLSGIHSQTL